MEKTQKTITVPWGEMSPSGYQKRHVETQLKTREQMEAWKRLKAGLDAEHVRTKDGKHVGKEGAQALRWLMEKIYDANTDDPIPKTVEEIVQEPVEEADDPKEFSAPSAEIIEPDPKPEPKADPKPGSKPRRARAKGFGGTGRGTGSRSAKRKKTQ